MKAALQNPEILEEKCWYFWIEGLHTQSRLRSSLKYNYILTSYCAYCSIKVIIHNTFPLIIYPQKLHVFTGCDVEDKSWRMCTFHIMWKATQLLQSSSLKHHDVMNLLILVFAAPSWSIHLSFHPYCQARTLILDDSAKPCDFLVMARKLWLGDLSTWLWSNLLMSEFLFCLYHVARVWGRHKTHCATLLC